MDARKRVVLEQVRSSLDSVSSEILAAIAKSPSSTRASSCSATGTSSATAPPSSAEAGTTLTPAAKKFLKWAKHKAAKEQKKAAAAAMSSLVAKESGASMESQVGIWSKVREATFDAVSSSSCGTSLMNVDEESDCVEGMDDGDLRQAIEAAIDRRIAVDPEWKAQEEQVVAKMGQYKFWCHGECEQHLPSSKLLLMNHGEDWCGDVITMCQQCVQWEGTDKDFRSS